MDASMDVSMDASMDASMDVSMDTSMGATSTQVAATVLEAADERWRVVRSLLLTRGLNPQFESYENFMHYDLQKIVTDRSESVVDDPHNRVRHTIRLVRATVCKPQHEEEDGRVIDLEPDEALLRGISYQCRILVDACHVQETFADDDFQQSLGTHDTMYRNITLCELPCLVGSSFCHLHNRNHDPSDPLGYFIVATSGSNAEKVFAAVQKLRQNWPVIKKNNAYVTEAEVRSGVDERFRSTSTIKIVASCPNGSSKELTRVDVHVPFITRGKTSLPIPLPCLMRLLHVDTLEDQMAYILPNAAANPRVVSTVRRALQVPESLWTRQEIFDWVAREGSGHSRAVTADRRRNFILHLFTNEWLPHIGRAGIDLHSAPLNPTGDVEGKSDAVAGENAEASRWSGRIRHAERVHAEDDEVLIECAKKAMYVGMVVEKLVHIHLGIAYPDDRDHYSNKRLDLIGQLLPFQFRMLFRAGVRQFVAAFAQKVERRPSVRDLLTQKFAQITHTILELMRRGAWSRDLQRNTGVVQHMSGQCAIGKNAFQRRIMMTLNKDGKNPVPRQLHPSQWGIVCAACTPEGAPCGLVTALAMFAAVSLGISTRDMLLAMDTFFGPNSRYNLIRYFDVPRPPTAAESLVYVNGRIIGFTLEPDRLEQLVIRLRRNRDLPMEVRCVRYRRPAFMARHVFINSDCSVAMRPLFIVENLHRVPDILRTYEADEPLFEALLRAHCVEYVDCEEQEARGLVVAVRPGDLLAPGAPAYSHVELDPTSILGMMASLVPFSHMDQSPRVVYETNMFRQAICRSRFNTRAVSDMHYYSLDYLQKPVVRTRMQDFLIHHYGRIPSGQNLIVAVMNARENIEDSLVFNKASLEAGAMRITAFKQVVTDVRDSEMERIMAPPLDCRMRHNANYDTLDADGLPIVGMPVKPGDAIIGKVAFCETINDTTGIVEQVPVDRSIIMGKKDLPGVIDSVESLPSKGYTRIRVRIRRSEPPVLGDKMASQHAQKGTVGGIVPPEDMPFVACGPNEGLRPDVLMSACAFPSRMTAGQTNEQAHAKVAIMKGEGYRDATTFEDTRVNEVARELEALGLHFSGKERMISGITGKPLECKIFIGPVYYHRLKHNVKEKCHSRSRGPKTLRERQPVEGRAKEGGQRFGEMEKSALVAHGAANLLRNRLCIDSDCRAVAHCLKCGLPAEHAHSTQFGPTEHSERPYCRACASDEHTITSMIPHGGYLFWREVQATQMAIRLKRPGKK